MRKDEITEVLNRPYSRDLLARDITRLAYVATDGTPRPRSCSSAAGPTSTSSTASRTSTSR